jgi:hypothetical protein
LVRLAVALSAVDVTGAGRLTERAALLSEDAAVRARLLVARVRLVQSGGQLLSALDDCVRAVELAHQAASEAKNPRLLRIVALKRHELNSHLRGGAHESGWIRGLDEHLAESVAASDDEGIVAAASAKITHLNMIARWDDMIPLIEILRGVSARLQDANLAQLLVFTEVGVLVYGSRPAEEAVARLQDMLVQTTERRIQANLHLGLVPLLAMAGRMGDAREHAAESERLRLEVGAPPDPVLWAFMVGDAELVYGDAIAAEAAITPALSGLEEQGEVAWASTLLAELAEAKLRQGHVEDARTLTLRARDITPTLDIESQSRWRGMLARIRLQDGDIHEADRLVHEALDYGRKGDQLESIGRLHQLAATVHLAANQSEAARTSLRAALDCFTRKGARTLANDVMTELNELTGPAV